MTTTLDEINKAIKSERDYQADKWGEPEHTIDEFSLYIAEYTNQLVHVAGTTSQGVPKLDAVRKIVALGIACMEQHGAPHRRRNSKVI